METLEQELTGIRTLKEKLRLIRAAKRTGHFPKPLPKFLETVYQEWKSQTEKQVGQAEKIDLVTNLWDVTGEYALFFLDIPAFRDALDLLKDLRADADQSTLRDVFARLVNVLPTRLDATL